jgi:predicted ester cyclase
MIPLKSPILICFFLISLLPFSCSDNIQSQLEKNKEIVRYIMEEGVNNQNLDAFNEILGENYVRHCQAMPPGFQEIKSIETMREFLTQHFAAFPDWNEEILFMVAEGDKVAYISRGTGTQTGPMGPIPATGKFVSIDNYIIQRIENGKIVESWVSWDNIYYLNQLGLIPSNL